MNPKMSAPSSLLPCSPAFSTPYSHTIPRKLMQDSVPASTSPPPRQHLPLPESPPCFSMFLAIRDPEPSHPQVFWVGCSLPLAHAHHYLIPSMSPLDFLLLC